MTRVIWANLNPEADARGSWDQGIVEELTAGYEHWMPDEYAVTNAAGEVLDRRLGVPWLKCGLGAVVVIPGQHNRADEFVAPLCEFVAELPWSLTIVTSDEEALFPVELLPHDDKHAIWGQYHARPEFDRVIPIGLPPGTRETLATIEAERVARMGGVYFAGQNTHERRDELIGVMKDMACDPIKYGNLAWLGTTGFRAGVGQERYLRGLRDARIAPCPSGYHSLDSFRLYEALAAGCIPIVEHWTPDGEESEFWDALLGPSCPIPRVESWHELPDLVQSIQKVVPGEPCWRDLREEIRAWWTEYQSYLAADFKSAIARLQS